jgi:hypothetical protein
VGHPCPCARERGRKTQLNQYPNACRSARHSAATAPAHQRINELTS